MADTSFKNCSDKLRDFLKNKGAMDDKNVKTRDLQNREYNELVEEYKNIFKQAEIDSCLTKMSYNLPASRPQPVNRPPPPPATIMGNLFGTNNVTVPSMTVDIIIDKSNKEGFGDLLKLMPPKIATKSVSPEDLNSSITVNKDNANSVVPDLIKNVQGKEDFETAYNKQLSDSSKLGNISKLAGSYPSAPQVISMYDSLSGEAKSKYESLRAAAAKSIADLKPTEWQYDTAAANLYKEMVKESTVKFSDRLGAAASIASNAASSAFSSASNITGNDPAALRTNAIKSLDKWVNDATDANGNISYTAAAEKGTGLNQAFVDVLGKLKTQIKNAENSTALDYGYSVKQGYSSKLRKLATNLNNSVKVKNGEPKWNLGIYTWKSPVDFEKDILNADRQFGGRRTRKHKKSKTQKGGRKNKKSRKN